MNTNNKPLPSIFISLVPLVFLVATIISGMTLLESSPHIPILMSTVLAALIAMFVLKIKWEEIEKGILRTINSSMSAILILMTVGVVIGTWMLSGVVPTMIYYGLQIISPKLFLPCVLIVCSIVSICIGSSWTTVSTVGIAFVGIGVSMGYDLPMIAGAIISGAYFGDKMSPFSDTTNLASASAGVNLYTHIKHMFFTTGVTYLICLVIFSVLSLNHEVGSIDAAELTTLRDDIAANFNVSPVLLLAPVLVIVLAVLRVPAILGLIAGAVFAAILAIVYQGASIGMIVECMHYGFASDTGSAVLDELLGRGGLDSMMWTVSMIILAMMFAGVLETSGMIESITSHLGKLIRSRGSLVLVTGLTSIGMNFATGEQMLSIIVPGKMYKEEYIKHNLDPKNLSRVLEDCGTITSPLIPWNGCGAYMIATLGLAPWVYVPYCFFNIINPIVSVLFGYLGITMTKLNKEEPDAAKAEEAK